MRGGLGLVALAVLFPGFCCAPVTRRLPPPSDLKLSSRFPPALNKVFTVYNTTKETYGMGCPIRENLAYTAGHLAEGGALEALFPGKPSNKLKVLALSTTHDIALLGGEFDPVPVAKEAPLVGDKVYYRGMLSSGQQTAMEGTVLGLTPHGDIVIDGWGAPGMSGSCVFDERGEVVGDMKHIVARSDRIVRALTVATSIVEGVPYLLKREKEDDH